MSDQFFPELIGSVTDPETGSQAYVGGTEMEYKQKTRYWLEAAYEEARYELSQNDEVKKMSKYVDYITGKQWPSKRPSYRSSPTNNRIWRLLWELIALLTDIRPIFEVKATKKEYDAQANMLNKITRSWWLTSDADLSLAMSIIYSVLGTGYAKLTWDEELRNGQGDLDLIALGPNDVLPLKPRHSLQSAQAVIYKSLRPLGWFRQKFGARGTLVQSDPGFSRYATEPGRPSHIPSMVFDALSPQMKHVVGEPGKAADSSYPQALYREFWIKDWTINTSNRPVRVGRENANWSYTVAPGKRLYPRGRLLVTGGEHNMYDGPNPYWHGLFPFEVLRMNVVPWQFMGLSDLGPLLPLQDIVNNIFAGVLDMVKKAVNPGFYGPKNAFSESMWNTIDWSMPGMKAGYSSMVAQKPDFAPQPQLPSFVMQMGMLAMREMDQSSGIAALSDAMNKKQVPSGETLERIRDAKQTPLRLKGRNIEVFLRNLGSQNIFNIFQFYDAQRRMWMLGQEGLTFEDFDSDPGTAIPAGMRPEDHAKSFVFMIQPGSLLNANRMEEAMMYARLRMMGDLDRTTFFQKLDLGLDVDKVEKGLMREVQQGIAMHPPKGKGAGGAPGGKK
jgi:hypothetical protein